MKFFLFYYFSAKYGEKLYNRSAHKESVEQIFSLVLLYGNIGLLHTLFMGTLESSTEESLIWIRELSVKGHQYRFEQSAGGIYDKNQIWTILVMKHRVWTNWLKEILNFHKAETVEKLLEK